LFCAVGSEEAAPPPVVANPEAIELDEGDEDEEEEEAAEAAEPAVELVEKAVPEAVFGSAGLQQPGALERFKKRKTEQP
jgi:hypothetical protein